MPCHHDQGVGCPIFDKMDTLCEKRPMVITIAITSLFRKGVVRIPYFLDMTSAVYRGHLTRNQTNYGKHRYSNDIFSYDVVDDGEFTFEDT